MRRSKIPMKLTPLCLFFIVVHVVIALYSIRDTVSITNFYSIKRQWIKNLKYNWHVYIYFQLIKITVRYNNYFLKQQKQGTLIYSQSIYCKTYKFKSMICNSCIKNSIYCQFVFKILSEDVIRHTTNRNLFTSNTSSHGDLVKDAFFFVFE